MNEAGAGGSKARFPFKANKVHSGFANFDFKLQIALTIEQLNSSLLILSSL